MTHDQRSQPGAGEPAAAAGTDWTKLVGRIRADDQSALEELYRLFWRGIRFYLCRQLGPQELEDKVHDTFLIVVQAIQRGDLREPERLMGFVRTIVKRQVAASIEHAVQSRRDLQSLDQGGAVSDAGESPEESVISGQRMEIMRSVLRSISTRDSEILTRFYLLEQTQEEICTEMKLSETQFRLLKSRAKARFGELGRRKLTGHPPHKILLRKAAGASH